VQRDRQAGAQRRDVAVEALADLVGAQVGVRRGSGTSMASTNSPAAARSSCSPGRSPSSGTRRSAAPRRSTMRASSAISTGAPSPMGEPLATLPPSVPAWRTGGDAKRATSRPARPVAQGQRGPGVFQRGGRADDQRAVVPCRRGAARPPAGGPAPAARVLLVHPQPDVGRAGQQPRLGCARRAARQAAPACAGHEGARARGSVRPGAGRWPAWPARQPQGPRPAQAGSSNMRSPASRIGR
jgi:hypothetical protein